MWDRNDEARLDRHMRALSAVGLVYHTKPGDHGPIPPEMRGPSNVGLEGFSPVAGYVGPKGLAGWDSSGFKGCQFESAERNEAVYAIAGTEAMRLLKVGSIGDFRAATQDIQAWYGNALKQLYSPEAKKMRDDIVADLAAGKQVVLTGHSLGGRLAQLMTVQIETEMERRFPGQDYKLDSPTYAAVSAKGSLHAMLRGEPDRDEQGQPRNFVRERNIAAWEKDLSRTMAPAAAHAEAVRRGGAEVHGTLLPENTVDYCVRGDFYADRNWGTDKVGVGSGRSREGMLGQRVYFDKAQWIDLTGIKRHLVEGGLRAAIDKTGGLANGELASLPEWQRQARVQDAVSAGLTPPEAERRIAAWSTGAKDEVAATDNLLQHRLAAGATVAATERLLKSNDPETRARGEEQMEDLARTALREASGEKPDRTLLNAIFNPRNFETGRGEQGLREMGAVVGRVLAGPDFDGKRAEILVGLERSEPGSYEKYLGKPMLDAARQRSEAGRGQVAADEQAMKKNVGVALAAAIDRIGDKIAGRAA